MDTSSCALTSIRTHFRIGVLLMARARAVKDAKGSSLQPSTKGTAIKVDHCALQNSNGLKAFFSAMQIARTDRSGMTSANDTYAAASIAAAETTKITAMSTAAHM